MFKFENPALLYGLFGLLPLILLLIYYTYWRKKAFAILGDSALIAKLVPERSQAKYMIKYLFLLLAFISFIIGLANPLIGTKFEKVKRVGIDIIIALDVSNSMLAEDVKPNRMDRAKQFVNRLIDKLGGDRVGLVVFAGKAFLQVPITTDHTAAKLFVRNISTEMIATQGTAIAEAIELSNKAFDADEKKYKVILVLTDGENHEGNVLQAVEEATAEGVKIYTIGIGSTKGAPIPVYKRGVQADYKRDKEGNIVLSKLNETALQQLAVKGDGKYFAFNSGNREIESIITEIRGLEQKEYEESIFTDYEDQFQYFLALAFLFLVTEYFIAEKRSKWWYQLKNSLFNKN